MKNIKDLKEDILNKNAGNLFIFNGDEWAIKKHYISKIAEDYKVVQYVKDTVELSDNMVSRNMFKKKTLYVVPHDLDFLKATAKEYQSILKRADGNDDGFIWIYSTQLTKTFVEHFNDYITQFDEVEEDIFYKLVEHHIKLIPAHMQKLAVNCELNYGAMLNEIDKIQNYAEHEHMSPDVAFEDLEINGQLMQKKELFSCNDFMNHLLIKDFRGVAHSLKCLKESEYKDTWYYLEEMINDLKILYCLVKYGKWDGAKRAYDVEGLFWGRIKELRDVILPFKGSKCQVQWEEEEIQYLIQRLSRYDSLAKQGKITNREVIEDIFYYYV